MNVINDGPDYLHFTSSVNRISQTHVDFFEREHFGVRMRGLFREVFGIAQNNQIADVIGVSESGVGNYMKGRVPEMAVFERIINLTQCAPTWLLTGLGPKYLQPGGAADVQTALPQTNQPFAALKEAQTVISITQLAEVGSRGIHMTQLDTPVVSYLSPNVLRNRQPEEVLQLVITTDDFRTDGYLPGQHVLAVPCTPEEVQNGDLCFVEVEGRWLLRKWFRVEDHICLDHRLDYDRPLHFRAERLTLHFRVIG